MTTTTTTTSTSTQRDIDVDVDVPLPLSIQSSPTIDTLVQANTPTITLDVAVRYARDELSFQLVD